MMKKGTMQTLIGIVLALFALTILHNTVYAQVIKPMLFDNTKTSSYDNFVILTGQIQDLLNRDDQTASAITYFEMEPGYTIIGFEEGQPDSTIISCNRNDISKPVQCGSNPCICLFKGELKDEDKKKVEQHDNDKIIVDKCFKPEVDGELKMYRKPRDSYAYNTGTCHSWHGSQDSSVTENIDGVSFVPLSFLNLNDNVYYTEELFMFVESTEVGRRINKKIFVLSNNLYNDYFYKNHNICPSSSEDDCKRKHYDEIIEEINYIQLPREIDSDMGPGIGTQHDPIIDVDYFSCSYDERTGYCKKEEVYNCTIKIREKCACGDTAYDSGFCIETSEDVMTIKPNIPNDYCFIKEASSCNDYRLEEAWNADDITEYNYQSDEVACTLDICKVSENGCRWKGRSSTPASCEECPESTPEDPCDCDRTYTEPWMKQENPCRCDCPED